MKIQSLLIGLLVTTSLFASKGGGGGDPEEMRVDDIRSDLVKWIEKGGAQGLRLPYDISLNEYENGMLELLAPKKVSVIFVDQDHATDEELQVLVNNRPKTCRGFFSRNNNDPYILCHRSRFQATPEAHQYRLIHHEYAGLAYLERNDGDSSDYVISNQITNFLAPETVLRLGVKNNTNELPNVDTSAFIVDPNIGGVLFSSGSDQNGVCRALGYEKGAPGSAVIRGASASSGSYLIVNSQGIVSGGDNGKSYNVISQLICVNQIRRPLFDATIIREPKISNQVYFSSGSDQNGVCRALGYEKGAPGSAIIRGASASSGSYLIVNSEGKVTGGDNGTSYNVISQIACINFRMNVMSGAIIVAPKHPLSQQPFSSGSDQNGVCRALGYQRGAAGSAVIRGVSAGSGSYLIVNSEGNVTGGDNGTSYNIISQIACINQ